MESKGKSEQLHAHFVVRRKVYDRRFVAASALHCYLPRFKLNLMLFGFADDRAAEILIRAPGSQPDSASDLRREVPISTGSDIVRCDPRASRTGRLANYTSKWFRAIQPGCPIAPVLHVGGF